MSAVTTGASLRPTAADIDLDAIRHNVRELTPPSADLMAVVKADGYGHGAVPVALAALDAGAAWLGVALVEEGIELREAGIEAPILVLSELPSGSPEVALRAGLTPTVYSDAALRELADAAGATGASPAVHVKVDTGMHRVGARPEAALRLVEEVRGRGLELGGVWTHLARSEERSASTTDEQLERFEAFLVGLKERGIHPPLRHAANSGGTIAHPRAHLDLVRVGIAMYGIAPGEDLVGERDLRPAMTVRSRVTHVQRVPAGEGISYGHRYSPARDTTVATVPIGYADGYRRTLAPAAHALIRGRRYPVAGTITMDQTMFDVGDDPVEPGDEVVLLGAQAGERISAEEMGGWGGTIGYEIVTGIGPRVPRTYVGG